jgi:hypothetical protein
VSEKKNRMDTDSDRLTHLTNLTRQICDLLDITDEDEIVSRIGTLLADQEMSHRRLARRAQQDQANHKFTLRLHPDDYRVLATLAALQNRPTEDQVQQYVNEGLRRDVHAFNTILAAVQDEHAADPNTNPRNDKEPNGTR